MTINERIKCLRTEYLHLTTEKFGEPIGVTRAAISNVENGNRNASDQLIRSICREFGAREEWLRSGAGDPFGPQTRNQKILAFANQVMADEDESFRKCLVETLGELEVSDWEVLEKISLGVLEKMARKKD